MKLILFVVLAMSFLGAGCALQRTNDARLHEAQLEALIEESVQAMFEKDIDRILRDMAPEWQGTLTLDAYGTAHTQVFGRNDYAAYLEMMFHFGEYVSVSLTNVVIDIAQDGQSAKISSELYQKFRFQDQMIHSHGITTNIVQLMNQSPMAVKTETFARYLDPVP